MRGHLISRDAFGSWLDAYGHAWETKDSQAFARLFAEDAAYQVTPFEEPMRGRMAILAYLSEATRTQDQICFEHEILAIAEDRGIAHWQVSFVLIPSQGRVELDGIFVAYFDAGGLCAVFREWWHERESESD